MTFNVCWLGGRKDGEVIESFDDELEAVEFADWYVAEHDIEFHPVWGGIAVIDSDGNLFY